MNQNLLFLVTNSTAIIKEHTKASRTKWLLKNFQLTQNTFLKIHFIVGSGTERGKRRKGWSLCQILTLTLGWEGKVPLAFMVFTSLLNAVISPSFLSCRLLVTALRVSSKCSAMKGVEFFSCWSTFKPLSPASTSSTESTTPECAEKLRKFRLSQAKEYMAGILFGYITVKVKVKKNHTKNRLKTLKIIVA